MFRDRDWAEVVLHAEETGRSISEEVEMDFEQSIQPEVTVENSNGSEDVKRDKVTRVVKRTGLRESTSFSIESGASWTVDGLVTGPGRLRQLVLKADRSDFSLIVKLDGATYLRDTWTDLDSFTNEIDAVTAFQDGDKYVAEVNDLHFRNSLSTSVVPSNETLFDLVYMEVEQEP